ncbi:MULTISPECIES: pentapeptide repeat-containing protein [unclassified Microcoleus]|uniref:pentapeptide repeat-containing protein n=1 Tax=unclassified Microcoleus TaxID=2642155 RepID=UPI002FCF6A4E
MSSLTFQNFRGQNLQGRSFKGQDLTNTDFSDADIRGTDFTGATLDGANFSHARCGLTVRSQIKIFIIVALISAMSGTAAVTAITHTFSSLFPKSTEHLGLIPTAIILLVNAVLLAITIRQGIQKALGSLAMAAVIFVPCIAVLSAISNDKHPILSWLRGFRPGSLIGALAGEPNANNIPFLIVTLTAAVAATMIVVVALPLAVALAEVVLGRTVAALAVFEALAISAIATGIITNNSARYLKAAVLIQSGFVDNKNNKCYDFLGICLTKFSNPPLVIAIIVTAVILAVTLVLLGTYIGNRVLAEDDKYAVIRQLANVIAAAGGTSFRGANLANANFSYAILKNTDFRFANIHRTMWHKSSKIDWARVGETILINPTVRDLLVTGHGYNKSYQGMDLRGANLIGVDLGYAKLQTADLSQATLEAANLEYASFSQVQAIGTDFSNARMTGACGLGTWNIDSTTKLEWVDCRWVYLLEEPKPGTDDRERRPHSEKAKFEIGEFTSFFQEVVNTVDLIFRDGVDWKAFFQSFRQVQDDLKGTELKIQSIENKGNGVVVIKVSVPPDADKEKIETNFNSLYQEMLELVGEKKAPAIQDFPEQRRYLLSVVEKIVKPLSEQVVVLNLDRGELQQGFAVSADIFCDGHRLPIQIKGNLPPQTEILERYKQWEEMYNIKNQNSRIKGKEGQVTYFSIKKLTTLAEEVEAEVNNWLNSEPFYPIEQKLHDNLNPNDEVRVIVQTEDAFLRKLPWHGWKFFEVDCHQAEVALSCTVSNRIKKLVAPRNKVRILAILGDDTGINIDEDKQVLENLQAAETVFLLKPTREEFEQCLRDQTGWDILCFSGHSHSEVDGSSGVIYINETDKLTVEQLRNSLEIAIERGLEIAIFNSCDGLGLGRQLADLDIPQIIVMREPVPDAIAQEFLKNFLKAFAGGDSLYVSVRSARKELKKNWDEKLPGASWLPAICQNQSEYPKKWRDFQGNSSR